MHRVYSDCANPAKLNCGEGSADFLNVLGVNALSDSRQREMRREGARIFFVAEAGCFFLDAFLQGGQSGWGVESDPDDANPFRVWERTESANLHVKLGVRIRRLGEHLFEKIQMSGRHVSKKLQGQMHVWNRYPANPIFARGLTQTGGLIVD